MVATALDAAQQLAEQGIHVRVVDPVTVKPLDEELVIRCAQETGCNRDGRKIIASMAAWVCCGRIAVRAASGAGVANRSA